MSLSDSKLRVQRKSGPRRAVTAKHKYWSDGQKLEAVTTFLMIGNVRLAAGMLKIPEVTIRAWMRQDWWHELCTELKTQGDLQLNARLKGIIDKSLDVVSDRLENGDWIYDQKLGEVRRKPVNMKDAHKVAMDMVDKSEVIRARQNNQPTNVEVDDKLMKLAQMFSDIATKKLEDIQRPTINVTDIVFNDSESPKDSDVVYQDTPKTEDIDALHEERETGL